VEFNSYWTRIDHELRALDGTRLEGPTPVGPPLAAHGIDIEECVVNDIVRWVRRCADNNGDMVAQLGAEDAHLARRDARCFRFIAEQIEGRAWQQARSTDNACADCGGRPCSCTFP
jgi:hypothetical protein